jgi:hypothetical protein
MRPPILLQFCSWLEQTPLSQAIQGAGWIVPAVQTVHILAIAAVIASQVVITLRLMGLAGRRVPERRFAARFFPFLLWSLPVLLLTGVVMIIAEPARELANPVFQVKMLLLIAAIALASAVPGRLGTGIDGAIATARLLSIGALALWVGIVLAGRWIAYI